MPRRKTQQSEVSEPAVSEAFVETVSDEDIVHDANPANVDELIDVTAGVQKSSEAPTSEEKFVQYIGRATERQIDSEAWPDGCERNISVVWGFHNSFKVPAAVFTENQLKYLLGNQDGGFKLVDGART